MKRILTRIFVLVLMILTAWAPRVLAQQARSPFNQPWYFAADYGTWAVQSQAQNTYVFSPYGLCSAVTPNGQFFPFALQTPLLIADVSAANSEIVTPSAITKTSNSCGFSGTFANNHFSFQVRSGTAGLQEALNALAVTTSPTAAVIYLDRNWYAGVSALPGKTAAGLIAAAKGNAKAYLVDLTTAPATYYTWNGTAYVAVAYAAH